MKMEVRIMHCDIKQTERLFMYAVFAANEAGTSEAAELVTIHLATSISNYCFFTLFCAIFFLLSIFSWVLADESPPKIARLASAGFPANSAYSVYWEWETASVLTSNDSNVSADNHLDNGSFPVVISVFWCTTKSVLCKVCDIYCIFPKIFT